jgi:hypothetical protein
VAAESGWEGWPGPNSGRAKMVIGKQAMIANPTMPNKIRIELVVIFMLHLQYCAADGRRTQNKSSRFAAMLQKCHKPAGTFRNNMNIPKMLTMDDSSIK